MDAPSFGRARARPSFVRIETTYLLVVEGNQPWPHARITGPVADAAAGRIRTDHAPENLVLVRNVALALLRRECTHTHGLTSKRLRAGLDHDCFGTGTVLRGARSDQVRSS